MKDSIPTNASSIISVQSMQPNAQDEVSSPVNPAISHADSNKICNDIPFDVGKISPSPDASIRLRRNIRTHAIICGTSAALGIIFYPCVLFALLTRCFNNPNKWAWDGLNESVEEFALKCKIIVYMLICVAVAIWTIISTLMIGVFAIGIVMLFIMAGCTLVFILVAVPPLGSMIKKHKSQTAPVSV